MGLLLHTGALIWTGASLSVGFWCGKKITNKLDNKIDEYLFQRSEEFKKMKEELSRSQGDVLNEQQ